MDLDDEIKSLRRYLDDLADENDDALARYELSRPRMPPGFYWRVRWLAGWTLRWLESVGVKPLDPWPSALKHHNSDDRAKVILIWAVGSDREELRKACLSFAEMPTALAASVPVLVTDVADFAFFSRLGWLVEYLPNLSGAGDQFSERKARLLAKLYRDVPALPVGVILEIASRRLEPRLPLEW